MGDRVVNEFVALFVFLKRAGQGGERGKGKGKKKENLWRRGKEREGLLVLLTSVVTSRFRYSIQTRIGEFIDPEFLCYRYDGDLRRRQRLG